GRRVPGASAIFRSIQGRGAGDSGAGGLASSYGLAVSLAMAGPVAQAAGDCGHGGDLYRIYFDCAGRSARPVSSTRGRGAIACDDARPERCVGAHQPVSGDAVPGEYLLWGVFAGLFRLVPYVGAPAATFFPTVLALAIFHGWGPPALVVLLFVLLELISSNVVEPLLYGARTGI